MNHITMPSRFNYIAAFLTLRCNNKCSYCVNHHGKFAHQHSELSGKEWIELLESLETDLPITLTGGEPTLHKDFYYIINNLNSNIPIDILTNLSFNTVEFMHKINPDRLERDAPYASIRASWHPDQMLADVAIQKVLNLTQAGFQINLCLINHPAFKEQNKVMEEKCNKTNIDFRVKEFLGFFEKKLYGTYKYKDACKGAGRFRMCRTSELLINPMGKFFRCHRDLYANENLIKTSQVGNWLSCNNYGFCHPCDVRLHWNRFQKSEHCSVEIKKESENGSVNGRFDRKALHCKQPNLEA